MICLTRLNQVPLVLNSDLIEHIEMTPDTVISLTKGQKLMVRETSGEVVERVIQFRRAVLLGVPFDCLLLPHGPSPSCADDSPHNTRLQLTNNG